MDVSCPWCGVRLSGHIPVGDEAPAVPIADTASICLHCAHAAIFDHGPFGLILRLPTSEEWDDLKADEEFMAALAAAQKDRRGRES